MNLIRQLLLLLTVYITSSYSQLSFPNDFVWGAASSSYQIEGGWNIDGKGKNIMDDMTHKYPQLFFMNQNGDVACDSYHKYTEDVVALKYLGVNHYRFSLSWSRILPTGFENEVNQAGVDYYNNLIDLLLANGIEPAVTLYHWDLPLPYIAVGGWTNEYLIKKFVLYARLAFQLFGDRVKLWSTFNEPKIVCSDFPNYVYTKTEPSFPSGIYEYQCAHNVIKAHALAYRIYDEEFRPTQNGKISIVLNLDWAEPLNTENGSDQEAAERQRQFWFGWFANPIIYGDYPQVMKERIAYRSKLENYTRSRLPTFSELEKLQIKGTYDYIGINHYTTWLVSEAEEGPITDLGTFAKDQKTVQVQNPEWEGSGTLTNKIVPWGLRHFLQWIKKTYGDVEIYITENGLPDLGGLDDQLRVKYYKEYLTEVRNAIAEDNINVKGYFAWSLLDNFEWFYGYLMKYGLFEVDFDDPERPRTAKKSAEYFKSVTAANAVV